MKQKHDKGYWKKSLNLILLPLFDGIMFSSHKFICFTVIT